MSFDKSSFTLARRAGPALFLQQLTALCLEDWRLSQARLLTLHLLLKSLLLFALLQLVAHLFFANEEELEPASRYALSLLLLAV